MYYLAFFFNGASYRIYYPSFKLCWTRGLAMFRMMIYNHRHEIQDCQIFRIYQDGQSDCLVLAAISLDGITLDDGREINRRNK